MSAALPTGGSDAWNAAALYAALLVARLIPIVGFTPLFGGEATSRRMRAGLALLLAAPIAVVRSSPSILDLAPATYALLVVKELVVGAAMAIAVLGVFEALVAAGSLVDLGRGQSLAALVDPSTRQQVSPLASFLRQASLVLFLTAGGYGAVASAFEDSIRVLPPSQLLPSLTGSDVLLETSLRVLPRMFLIAVRLALPVFAVSLVIDVAFGLLGRAASAFDLGQLSLPLRTALGLVVFLATLQLAFSTAQIDLAAGLGFVASGLRW